MKLGQYPHGLWWRRGWEDMARHLWRRVHDLEKQRAELVDALRSLIDAMDCDGCIPYVQGEEYPEVTDARAVLAKLEGGPQG